MSDAVKCESGEMSDEQRSIGLEDLLETGTCTRIYMLYIHAKLWQCSYHGNRGYHDP